ncbi:MAG: Nif11-like leader peptide family natural product precursor [Prochlorococcus sp.]
MNPKAEEQFKAFIDKVQADQSLQQNLRAAADIEETDAVLTIAKGECYVITADNLQNSRKELPEEGLENVAGGRMLMYNASDCGGICLDRFWSRLGIGSLFKKSFLLYAYYSLTSCHGCNNCSRYLGLNNNQILPTKLDLVSLYSCHGRIVHFRTKKQGLSFIDC